MSSLFSTKLNRDIRFMIYDLFFTTHTIELTSEKNQSPLWCIGKGHRELRAEISAWLEHPKQREWTARQQKRNTNCPKRYGPFTPTTLFTCDLSMQNAKACLDELALDTQPGFPLGGEAAEDRGYEDIKHLRLDARNITLHEFFDLEIDMHHFFTEPSLEIVVGTALARRLRRVESMVERTEPDWCTVCHFLFPHCYRPHIRQDCTCVVLQSELAALGGEERLARVLEVETEEDV